MSINILKKSSIVFALIVNAFALSWVFEYVCLGKPNYLVINFVFVLAMVFFSKARLSLNIFGLLLALALPGAKVIGSGIVQNAVVEVIFGTSVDEIIGFHSVLPSKLLLTALAVFCFFLAYVVFNKRLNTDFSKKGRIGVYALLLISLPFFTYKSYEIFAPRVNDIIDAYKFITDKSAPKAPEWVIKEQKPSAYDTYVVVIGESMRSDFLSLFGFKVDTTPNLKSIPHKAIDGMVSPGPATAVSVPLLLSTADGAKPLTHNNAVNLAQMAGFETFWISSQGFTGDNNYPAAIVSRYAQNRYFNQRMDDFALLDEIKKAVLKEGKKVIFVHIVGSHENPCSRLFDYKNQYDYKVGKTLNCYFSTLNKTDEFLSKTVEILKNSNKTYSLSYISDHGVNFVGDDGDFSVFRDMGKKQQYKVPFYVTSSDMTEHTVIKAQKSGFNFINYFADAIGVKTNLTIDNYDVFSPADENVFVTLLKGEIIPFDSLEDGVNPETLKDYIK